MTESVKQILQRCYENSHELVYILDEAWNVVWASQSVSVGYFPMLLGISEASWENCTKRIYCGQDSYICRLLCNQKDGVRIAVLEAADNESVLMDTEVVTNAVFSVNAACSALHSLLDEEEIYDNMDLLKSITGNCYRIYRMAYLQKELERWQAGNWRKECFSLKNTLIDLQERVRKIIGTCVFSELHCCDTLLYLKGDMDAFIIAVLSAIAICYTAPEKMQSLVMTLEAQKSTAVLTISMTPRPEDRIDTQNRISEFGGLDGEQKMLDLFCKVHGGHCIQGTTGDTNFCRIELPTSEESSHVTLKSPMEEKESRFYNKYEILLSRIMFRGFF